MRPSDPADECRPGVDWRGGLMLAWVAVFGVLYVRTVLECRAPGVLAAIRGLLPGGGAGPLGG